MDVVLDGKHGHRLADESLPYPADCENEPVRLQQDDGRTGRDSGQRTGIFHLCLAPGGMYGPGDKYHLPQRHQKRLKAASTSGWETVRLNSAISFPGTRRTRISWRGTFNAGCAGGRRDLFHYRP